MIDSKPFAMFFNASPRKGWNTHKILEAAKAKSRGIPRLSESLPISPVSRIAFNVSGL